MNISNMGGCFRGSFLVLSTSDYCPQRARWRKREAVTPSHPGSPAGPAVLGPKGEQQGKMEFIGGGGTSLPKLLYLGVWKVREGFGSGTTELTFSESVQISVLSRTDSKTLRKGFTPSNLDRIRAGMHHNLCF